MSTARTALKDCPKRYRGTQRQCTQLDGPNRKPPPKVTCTKGRAIQRAPLQGCAMRCPKSAQLGMSERSTQVKPQNTSSQRNAKQRSQFTPGQQLTLEPFAAGPARARLQTLAYGSCECVLARGGVGFVAAAAASTKQTVKLKQFNETFRGMQTEAPPQTISLHFDSRSPPCSCLLEAWLLASSRASWYLTPMGSCSSEARARTCTAQGQALTSADNLLRLS